MTGTPQLLPVHHLKTLKLPAFLREYGKLARQCAAAGAGHVRYLVRLAELELIDRERRMVERRIRQARFPAVKSLDSFDFKAIPSLNKMLVVELARCEYAERRENIIALGNSGTGKTHIALGLGLAACQKGLSVGFTTAAALVHELIEARDEKRLLRFQKQLAKYSLLVRGWVQRAGETVHLVAARLEDLSRWLDLLTPDCGSVRTSPDHARHGGRRLAAPHPRHPRDQRMVPRSRDFR